MLNCSSCCRYGIVFTVCRCRENGHVFKLFPQRIWKLGLTQKYQKCRDFCRQMCPDFHLTGGHRYGEAIFVLKSCSCETFRADVIPITQHFKMIVRYKDCWFDWMLYFVEVRKIQQQWQQHQQYCLILHSGWNCHKYLITVYNLQVWWLWVIDLYSIQIS